ncbi:MAG: CBS domain-containing protein, partial [Acidimicrobiia bacterium]|nr:CBS domain-containing protein [Acidimicrobiia bacterium]
MDRLPLTRLVDARSLIERAAPICEPETTIAEAARMMSGHRAVLVRQAEGYGIVTDADLRSRVVAAGLPPTLPVSQIMTYPARTVDASTSVEQVLLEMLEHDIHHLPVLEDETPIGLLSDLDILDMERHRPFSLRHRIDGL